MMLIRRPAGAAPSADARPTSSRIRQRVYAAAGGTGAARLSSQQVCLNNSSTRRRDTQPVALCAKMRRRVLGGLLADRRAGSRDLGNRSWDRQAAESHERDRD